MKKVLNRVIEVKGAKSCAAFSRLLDMRQQTVDGYLRDQRKLSLEFIDRVCCKCCVSADWLLGYTEDRKGHAAPVSDAEADRTIENLRHEIDVLRAENAGLRYAIDAIGKGGVTASARRTALATGA